MDEIVIDIPRNKREPEWQYFTERVHLIPYVDGNPSQVFPEDFLFYLYQTCKTQNLVDILFPGMQMTPARFVAYLKDRPILLGLVKPQKPGDGIFEYAGFGFLYEVENGKATVGFCFFRKWWGSPEISVLSKLCLRYWFQVTKLQIIFGTTLERNRLAIRFARNLGFRSVGRVPKFFFKNGKLEDAHLLYLTPELATFPV